jgi:hypothetical protein
MELRKLGDGLTIKGRLSITIFDEEKNVVDYREGDNVVCTNGLTVMAAALVWAGIQDVAGDLGVTSGTYLTPLYGAIGTGTGVVDAADVALFTELSRVQVGAGASVPATPGLNAQTTWQFYFPSPAINTTITEAGVFALATSTSGAGTMMDHWLFSPTVSFTTANTLLLQVSFSLAGV